MTSTVPAPEPALHQPALATAEAAATTQPHPNTSPNSNPNPQAQSQPQKAQPLSLPDLAPKSQQQQAHPNPHPLPQANLSAQPPAAPPQSQPRPAPPSHPGSQAHHSGPSSQPASTPNKRDLNLKSWWKGFKIPSKHQDSHESRPQGIFGVPLRQSITYANVAISLIDENGKSYIYGYVPIVVAKCGVFLKEKATGVEGIFRLSGSEKRIKELKNIFDSPDRYGKGLVWDGYTVHDAANVLRRYLNDLPEPVVPLDLYEKFREPLRGATMQAVGDAEGPQFVDNFDLDAAIAKYQQLITELPPLNRQLLLYILDLLAVFAAKSDENRMNSQNLAAIFQPGMLSHPAHAMAPEEYRLNQCVIIFLIENQDHFLIGMQGTAADEKTVQEVQKGTPPTTTPVTPNVSRKAGVQRSSSNASAGAESVARDGKIRRNRSTSSRHSRHSNGAPSPGSPALAPATTGGLGRSNTVPSKKSPAIGPGRFVKKTEQPDTAAALTPATPTPIPPSPLAEPAATPRERQRALAPGHIPIAAGPFGSTGKSQEGLLEPAIPEALTPSRERKLQSLFQRSPSDSDPRQPNKLRKKRLVSSTNPSAQSSTASLPHSAAGVSPSVEIVNPMERPMEGHVPEIVPVAAAPASLPADRGLPSPRQSAVVDAASEPTSRVSQSAAGETSPLSNAEQQTLRPTVSPALSLHSSANDGSDVDQIDETIPATELSEREKEKKRRWRLSRRREDSASAAAPPPVPAGPTSPRRVLGSNTNAEMSTSTFGSGGKAGRRSFNGDPFDPSLTALSASGEAQSSYDSASKDGRDEAKGLTGWIKNKYREAKENHDQRRNKSPPAPDYVSPLGSTSIPSTRGKSLDIKRPAEDEKGTKP